MTPEEQDLIARTIVGEAAGQPLEGQQAVANVIMNRLKSGKFGGSARDVVLAPYQFEPWQTRRAELESIKTDAPAYQNAMRALAAAQASDPTNGATHFLQPDIVRQRRGGTLPNWAQGPSQRIGDHLFFSPGGGGPKYVAPKSTTGPTPTNAPFAPPTTQLPETQTTLGSTIARMMPVPDAEQVLTDSEPMPQMAMSGGLDEAVDTTAFVPRTTKWFRRSPPRT